MHIKINYLIQICYQTLEQALIQTQKPNKG